MSTAEDIILDLSEDKDSFIYSDVPLPRREGPVPPRKERNVSGQEEKARRRSDPFAPGQDTRGSGRVPAMTYGRGDFPMRASGLEKREERFYRQALEYKDIQDDLVYRGEFRRYYTTYRDLSGDIRRGYFGWRTRARKGNYTEAPLSFIFLYVYEILAMAGPASPEKGFGILREIKEHYPEESLQRYLSEWMRDFIVYYGLGEEYLAEYFGEARRWDAMRAVLRDHGERSDEEIYEAVCQLSSYDPGTSVFFRNYPAEAAAAVGKVYRALSDFYKENRFGRFSDGVCGVRARWHYEMFRGAVFYDHKKHMEYSFEAGPYRTYRCSGGRWSVEAAGGAYSFERSRLLGETVHETDRVLREVFSAGHPLKKGRMNEDFRRVIEEAVLEFKKEREEAARPVITIDPSKLPDIRENAAVTRSQLLEGEEIPEGPEEADFQDKQLPDPSEGENMPGALPGGELLTADESEFLRLILSGEDWKGYTLKRGLFPSVLADSVNEKLFGLFGDNVIGQDEGGGYRAVPDYAEELESMYDGQRR